MATTKTQEVKQADIRYRVQLKNKPWIVIYVVRSSDDSTDYQVSVVRGKVNSCDCPAKKPCYHMRDVQVFENERKARIAEENASAMVGLAQEIANEGAAKRELAPLNGNREFSLMRR